MADEIDISSPSGANIYALIYRISDGKIADVVAQAFDTYAVADLGDYDLALTEASTNSGYYAADFPTWISAGDYRVVYKLRAGASPASTDITLTQEQFYWNGSTVSDSPSADYLTTLARVKAHLGITTSDYDTVLTSKLSAASRFVEWYCDRLFLSATRTQYYNGRGNAYLQLQAFPITAITRVAGTPETVLTIRNTSSSNSRATASCDGTNLTLIHTASASTTSNNLVLATYTTITTLAAAVDAASGSWDAAVQGTFGGYASADIATKGALDAKLSCGAEFEIYTEDFGSYRFNSETGQLFTIDGYFDWGYRNIEVRYTAGYASGAVPDDVQEATCSIAGALYNMSQTSGSGLKREKIGDYEYENFQPSMQSTLSAIRGISPDALMLLDAHRVPRML